MTTAPAEYHAVDVQSATVTATGVREWTTRITDTGAVEIQFASADPSVPPMIVGATVKDTDYARISTGGPLAGARVCRTFCPPGSGLHWIDTPPGVASHLSWKDWPADPTVVGWINDLLDTLPTRLLEQAPLLPELHPYREPWQAPDTSHAGFSLLMTWKHEGEPDCIAEGISVREWRRRHWIAYQTIREHRFGHLVGYMPIQTGTWTEAYSNLTLTPPKIKGDFDPFAWWAGVGDYAGYDAYVLSVTNKPASAALYPDPKMFLAYAQDLAHGVGRQLYLPEVGVIRQGNPADDGSLRADWIRRLVAYARTVGVAGISWWDSLGANSRDFRLDPISLQAWKDAIAGRI